MLGFHAIFGAYGFWLPNDPRGSWSQFVGSWELSRFGPPTKVTTTHSLAHIEHDDNARLAAKAALKRPPVHLTGKQARSAAMGFKRAAFEGNYRFFACAILPEHVHLVIGATARAPKRAIAHLKTRAIQQLVADSLWPNPELPAWSRGCWTVYLDSDADMRRAINYVEQNPQKERKPPQSWSFVLPYES